MSWKISDIGKNPISCIPIKKYAKDSQMVYYFRLEFEVQIDAHSNS